MSGYTIGFMLAVGYLLKTNVRSATHAIQKATDSYNTSDKPSTRELTQLRQTTNANSGGAQFTDDVPKETRDKITALSADQELLRAAFDGHSNGQPIGVALS